mmetsp:Transcript_45826/g.90264  ORF Transcript_45826/g.90264 Transcript_45826/m.90264 type:complete len:91 (-) Transcript_45826:115-387(-)
MNSSQRSAAKRRKQSLKEGPGRGGVTFSTGATPQGPGDREFEVESEGFGGTQQKKTLKGIPPHAFCLGIVRIRLEQVVPSKRPRKRPSGL